jgi:hypothetical protein
MSTQQVSRAHTVRMIFRTATPPSTVARPFVLVAVTGIMLVGGCTQTPPVVPPPPPRPTARVQPPDWFHQQLAAAQAARRAHQPASDTVGAQQAYDDTMRSACTRAALMGPGKYPARCDAVLHPASTHSPIDPSACEGNDDPAVQTECND